VGNVPRPPEQCRSGERRLTPAPLGRSPGRDTRKTFSNAGVAGKGFEVKAPQILIEKAYITLAPPADVASFAPLTVQSVSSHVQGFLNPDPNRFEYDAKTGIISDPLTGLMWGDEIAELTPDEAMEACKASRQGGYTDWTQSSLRDVLTIVDYTRNNPVLPPPFKTNGSAIWTATQTPWTKDKAGSSRSFFCVYVGSGVVDYANADLQLRARPVRRAAPASQ
jgi:hypothetical protein